MYSGVGGCEGSKVITCSPPQGEFTYKAKGTVGKKAIQFHLFCSRFLFSFQSVTNSLWRPSPCNWNKAKGSCSDNKVYAQCVYTSRGRTLWVIINTRKMWLPLFVHYSEHCLRIAGASFCAGFRSDWIVIFMRHSPRCFQTQKIQNKVLNRLFAEWDQHVLVKISGQNNGVLPKCLDFRELWLTYLELL